jgi:hypothetical protein
MSSHDYEEEIAMGLVKAAMALLMPILGIAVLLALWCGATLARSLADSEHRGAMLIALGNVVVWLVLGVTQKDGGTFVVIAAISMVVPLALALWADHRRIDLRRRGQSLDDVLGPTWAGRAD